jgi:hypothetical protein
MGEDVAKPVMTLAFASKGDGIEMCASGSARLPGAWSLRLAGARVHDTPGNWPIDEVGATLGATAFEQCVFIGKIGTMEGGFAVSFAYLLGEGTPVEAPSVLHAAGGWAPGLRDWWYVAPQL